MTDCAVCGRTLASTETEYTSKGKRKPDGAYEIICADCILKYKPLTHER